MKAVQVDIEQGSTAWHKWRRKGIGASDMAALFGVSPYKTARDLWFEKAGLGEPDDEDRSYIFQRGHETEKEIRDLFSKHTKIEVSPACFEKGIFLGSLDGYDKKLGILEAKLVGKEVLKRIAEGELPEHHRIQVQAQLFVADADKCFYGAKAPKLKTGHIVEVGRDEKMIKEIERKGREFWDQVASGKPPELSPQDTLFIFDADQIALFNRLVELKAMKDKIEAQYKEVEADVKSLAIHTRVRCGGVSITDVVRAGSIDYKKVPEVKALSEEYLEMFRGKGTTYKMIRISGEE